MKLVIFGCTGGTGRELVRQSLAQGHEVTAFGRAARSLDDLPRLIRLPGDPFNPRDVEVAVKGQDAVLCALGGNPNRKENVCSTAMRHIVPAMKSNGVLRIVAISTHGAGETRANVGWFMREVMFAHFLSTEVADKEAMERQLEASNLNWVVVRVGRLSNAARGKWRASDDGSMRGMGRIGRADVAAFMLAQLKDNEWLRRKPVLAY